AYPAPSTRTVRPGTPPDRAARTGRVRCAPAAPTRCRDTRPVPVTRPPTDSGRSRPRRRSPRPSDPLPPRCRQRTCAVGSIVSPPTHPDVGMMASGGRREGPCRREEREATMTDPGAETAAQSFDILGETVTLPVRVRDATIHTAMFAVPAQGAQDLVDPSGLTVAPVAPGRTLCALMFIDYLDGDLETYREYGVGFAVRGAGGPGAPRVGARVHRRPVSEEGTLGAGGQVWG